MRKFIDPLNALDYAKTLLHRRRFIMQRRPDNYADSLQIVRYKQEYWVCNPVSKKPRYLMYWIDKKPKYGKVMAEIYYKHES